MVESSGDTSQKIGLETNSGEFIPPRGAPRALSHSGPSKEIRQRSLKPPSRPQLDYLLVRLGTNPIGSAAYLPLPLPPVYLPLEAFAW